MGWFVGVLIVDYVVVVFQAVSHSLASHHTIFGVVQASVRRLWLPGV